MKKLAKLIIACFASCLLLAGCGSKTDEYGWYSDFAEAKKVASDGDKSILLFVHSVYDPAESDKAVKMLVTSKAFTERLSDFVCVNFDFSDESILRQNVPVNLTDEEQKAFERRQDLLKKQFSVADSYSIRSTPTLLVLTKEGYFVSLVNFDYVSDEIEGYVQNVLDEKDAIKEVNEKVRACKRGNKIQKIQAIDAFFESEPEIYRPLLIDLFGKIPEMDEENESGLVPKYIREIANADAFEYLIKAENEEAAKVYEKAAEDPRLSGEDIQKLYEIAITVFTNSYSPDMARIFEMCQKAIDAAPDTKDADNLRNYMKNIQVK